MRGPPDIQLQLHGQAVRRVFTARILGLIVDANLRNHSQVGCLRDTRLRLLDILKRCAGYDWGCSTKTLLRLHQGLIQSRLLYVLSYLSLTKTRENKLEVLNRRGIKTALGLATQMPSRDLYTEASINTLADLTSDRHLAQQHRQF